MNESLIRTFFIQLLLLTVVACMAWIKFDGLNALSAFLGGLIAIVPSFIFSVIFFKKIGTKPRNILNTFYFGEGLKLLLTIVFFILVFQWPMLQPLALFMGFIILQLAYWVILLNVR